MTKKIFASFAFAIAAVAAWDGALAQDSDPSGAGSSDSAASDFERVLNDNDLSIMRDNDGNATGVRTDGDVGAYVSGSAQGPTRENPDGDVTVGAGVVIEY